MENITLTKGQEEAIKVAVQRYKDNEKYTVIAGQPDPARRPQSGILWTH